MLHQRIKEPKEIMDLIDYVVDTSSQSDKGLNLGSEAPQIFAIYFLNQIDTYIKTVRSIEFYGRYMDDMFIISKDKEELEILLAEINAELLRIKLRINDRKTHITKLKKGFTFLQIKYSFDGYRIIKRPTRSKIVRERRRLKKYRKLYDKGLMSREDIRNSYLSWRNALIKDCNKSKLTIFSMDMLYKNLFPEKFKREKLSRDELVNRAYEDYMREVTNELSKI